MSYFDAGRPCCETDRARPNTDLPALFEAGARGLAVHRMIGIKPREALDAIIVHGELR